jgi:hypothetical protein
MTGGARAGYLGGNTHAADCQRLPPWDNIDKFPWFARLD